MSSTTPTSDAKCFEPPGPRIVPRPTRAYVDRLEKSFESGKNSDITLVCESRRFNVHKFQLCQHSDVLDALLQGHFKEAGQEEVELPDDDPDALYEALRFMYRFEYTLSPVVGECAPEVLHMRVSRLADKYNIPGLSVAAQGTFEEHVAFRWYQLGEAITEAWSDDGYDVHRRILLKWAQAKLPDFKVDPVRYHDFWDTAKVTPGFSADLLMLPKAAEPRPPEDSEASDEDLGFGLFD